MFWVKWKNFTYLSFKYSRRCVILADKTISKRFPADTGLDYLTFLNDKNIDGELYAYL